MRRRQLIEIHDEPWCPNVIREGLTDFLREFIQHGRVYRRALVRLEAAVTASGAGRIVDLCSGGGGPWPSWPRPAPVLLTDKYPNRAEIERLRDNPLEALEYHPEPVDATAVPPELTGFRTLFTCFHHFPPEVARSILADAVRRRQPVGVFELTYRHVLAIPLMLCIPLAVWAFALRMRPFSWRKLALTFAVPVIPLIATFDGLASCWRTYRAEEMLAMAREAGATGYRWEAGYDRVGPWPLPVAYLIGYPN